MLMVEQKMYIEHKAGQMQGRGPGSNFTQELHPYDPENPCANQPDITCKKIGVETVSGRTCDHWEITDKKGQVSNLWVDQKLHFPIKATTSDSSILLSNMKEGEPEASLFQVPSDYRKMDMGVNDASWDGWPRRITRNQNRTERTTIRRHRRPKRRILRTSFPNREKSIR